MYIPIIMCIEAPRGRHRDIDHGHDPVSVCTHSYTYRYQTKDVKI